MSNKGEKENGKRTSVTKRRNERNEKKARHRNLMNGNKEIKSGRKRKEEMTRKRKTRKRIERKEKDRKEGKTEIKKIKKKKKNEI